MAKSYKELTRNLIEHEIPFIVPTPRPYVVDLVHAKGTPEEARASLLAKVGALMHVLQLLDISLHEAYDKDYSLNSSTWEELERRAEQSQSTNRYVALIVLRNGPWQR